MFETAFSFFQTTSPTALPLFQIITWILALVALAVSIVSFRRTRAATLYSDIDARYMDLLKLGIANPKFVNPALTKAYKQHFSDDDLLAYQQYAFAAWNIVETIIDRRKVGDLGSTWDPVIREENRLHRAWLNDPDNENKFKKDFWSFMVRNYKALPCPTCELADRGRCPRCNNLLEMINSKYETEIIIS